MSRPVIQAVGSGFGVIQDGVVLRTFKTLNEAVQYLREEWSA